MPVTYTCEQCGGKSYEQFSQTQVRCLDCNTVSEYDSGYRVIPEFQLSRDSNILDLEKKVDLIAAPTGKRLANYIIDLIVVTLLIFLTGTVFNIEINTAKGEMTDAGLAIMLFTIPIYYTIMEYSFGKTFGKFFTKTKVISVNGNKPTLGQCALRSVSRLLPFEQFSGLFFKGIFWHDSIPKTLVVEDK